MRVSFTGDPVNSRRTVTGFGDRAFPGVDLWEDAVFPLFGG